MENKTISSKILSIRQEVVEVIRNKVIELNSDKSDDFWIALNDSLDIDGGYKCDTFIEYIELCDGNRIVFLDNNQNTYTLDDKYLPLEILTNIADSLDSGNFQIEKK